MRYLPLSGNDNGLTGAIAAHSSVGILCDSKEMRLEFPSPSTAVCLNDLWTIKSDSLERIHGYKDNARVCINAMLGIAIANGMENWNANDRQ